MQPPPDPRAHLLALREHAEARRGLLTQAAERYTPEEMQRLVQELQIHQIELEMQNEELLQAQAEIRQSHDRYVDLYDFAPVGYFTLDADGTIEALNLSAGQLLARPRQALLGRRLGLFLAASHRALLHDFLAQVLAADHLQRCELRLLEAGRWLEVQGLARPDAQGRPRVQLAALDASERHRLADEMARQRQQQQQEVLATVLHTQETERKRIAGALHDGVGQLLYIARLHLENTPGGPVAPAARDLLSEAIDATRTLAFELMPQVLEDFGLRYALEALSQRLAPSHLGLHLHLAGLEPRLSPQVEIVVYRLVQELLNNVLKHAHAREATVYVVREGQQLDVSVEDDGAGFVPEEVAATPLAGTGLAGIRNRVALLGGKLHLRSAPGKGTVVSCELPL